MEIENIPEKKKRKSSFRKTADWASLLRNFATIVASFISAITLFILLRQNERTYQPDLVMSPAPKVFHVAYRDTISGCEDLRIIVGQDSSGENLNLRAINLGLGAAKNLDILWHYDPSRLDDTVSIGTFRIPTFVTYNEEVNALMFRSCFMKESMGGQLEYCLPFNSEKEATAVSLPLNYVRMWSNLAIRIGLNHKIPRPERIKLLEQLAASFQDLTCSIRYFDINGREYRKSYKVRILPHFIDLRSRTLALGVGLAEQTNGSGARRSHRFTVYEPDASFSESEIEW